MCTPDILTFNIVNEIIKSRKIGKNNQNQYKKRFFKHKSTKGMIHILDYIENDKLLCIKTPQIEWQVRARKNIFVTYISICIQHFSYTCFLSFPIVSWSFRTKVLPFVSGHVVVIVSKFVCFVQFGKVDGELGVLDL